MTDFVEDVPCEMRHIFHPTDFSSASMAAFGHALKLSLAMASDLTIMHVDPAKADPDFEDFPRVRATLSRWGILREGATKEELFALGLGVRKIRAMAEDPIASILQLLWRKPADLMVLATHPKDTLGQWLSVPTGELLAYKSRTMSLFVPDQCTGLVSIDTGTVQVQRILIPVDHRPNPQAAVNAACMMTAALGVKDANFELLYVGSKTNMPNVRLPQREGWSWHQSASGGVVVYEILEAAGWFQPDLIVMATEWRHGFLDALRGSTTERVLRRTACPLLAVPVDALLASSLLPESS
jgi:nucleotide-binding universal stress UspA family protein